MEELKVTSFEQLKKYSEGQLVRLPDFAEGQPLVARIKRPSILSLAKSGSIPNGLIETANNLFMGKGINAKKNSSMKELFKILDLLCESCFIEPSYKEIKESGMELTDDQLMFIFRYSQEGVNALDSFRKVEKNNERVGAKPEIRDAAITNNED